jgi:dsRNA-specific ribonuclease
MPSRSRPSARLSTTSRTTSRKRGGASRDLAQLIHELPKERLRQAFTHSSWAGDRAESYERLEFLGDSVLGLAIARELYERFPDYQEGRLAKIRAHVVSRRGSSWPLMRRPATRKSSSG